MVRVPTVLLPWAWCEIAALQGPFIFWSWNLTLWIAILHFALLQLRSNYHPAYFREFACFRCFLWVQLHSFCHSVPGLFYLAQCLPDLSMFHVAEFSFLKAEYTPLCMTFSSNYYWSINGHWSCLYLRFCNEVNKTDISLKSQSQYLRQISQSGTAGLYCTPASYYVILFSTLDVSVFFPTNRI